jgi:probable HAF family extracellular repeat protein
MGESRRSKPARDRLRFVPQLMVLEDRLVPSYVFQTIDDPNGVAYNSTESINASGQIAGLYSDAAGVYHGYLLSGGQFTTIEDPNTGPGGFSYAYTINASGRLVGAYSDAAGHVHGYLLSGGQFTTLDDPNAVNGTQTLGLNANGKIAGLYLDANNTYHGFLLSGGQYTTIDDPNAGTGPGQGTIANEINASGKIVGEFIDANNAPHGFLFSKGQFTTIDDPNTAPGAFQFAGFINDHGVIAGGYTDSAGTQHGYLFNKGQFTTLDYPNAGPAGSYITGVNDSGTIVGFYYDSAGIGHGYEATPVHGKSDQSGGVSGAVAVLANSTTPALAASQGLPLSSSLNQGGWQNGDVALPAASHFAPSTLSEVLAVGAVSHHNPVGAAPHEVLDALFADFEIGR